MNPHVPERLPRETREAYFSRRELSREIIKTLTKVSEEFNLYD